MSNINDLLKLAGLPAKTEVEEAAPAFTRELKAGATESARPMYEPKDEKDYPKVQSEEQGSKRLSIGQQMARDGITYSVEREKELIGIIGDYLAKNGHSEKAIRYYLSYDEDFVPDTLSELPKEEKSEDDMEEGNEFSGELAKAKAQGDDEFEVDGKKYKVEEGAVKNAMMVDAENMSKEEFIKKYGQENADTWETMNESVDEELAEGDNIYHACTVAFEHAKYGHGTVIHGEHTLSESGEVTHYDAVFIKEDGSKLKVRNIPIANMINPQMENHGHPSKKKKVKEEEQVEQVQESEGCKTCGETPCVCPHNITESPTMDTTQLIHLLKLSGISEENIQRKLDEWANTPEGVGETEPTVHGTPDNYNFAQSVNLSLKRYLDAQDMKVQVTEHKAETLKALYEEFKKKK